jgi:Ca-activated chloride channel homolog
MKAALLVLSCLSLALLLSSGAQAPPPSPVPPPQPSPPAAQPSPTPTPPTSRTDAAPLPPAPARPALLVKTAEDRPSEALAITRMDVRAVVDGFLAETTTTLTFHNGYPRALEGELVFPLPEGATLSGYALDVNGEMVDGVVVEHHEARIAFEKEVRRGIDPGLVEWAQGNNFRTRVWPIPANGTRTVRVRHVSRLVLRGSGAQREAYYLLPLASRDRIAELALRVEVAHTHEQPQVREGGLESFRFDRWQDRFVAETRLTDAKPERDLVIALPRAPEQALALETDEDGSAYFAIDGVPDLPRDVPRAAARRVGLYWDASLSREGRDREAELRAVERWLQGAGALDVDVVVFRNETEPAHSFAVRGGDAGALLSFLRGTPCDGGTRLGSLRFAPGHDYDVLVSDGLDDLGGELPDTRTPLYVLNADSRANHALLDHLARGSGGTYVNLQETTVDDAAAAIGAPVARLLAVEFDPRQVADVRPPAPSALRGRLTVSGRLLAPEATLTLRYGVGGETRSRTYTLRQSEAMAGRLVPRVWAEQRISQLSVFPERHHDEMLALGRRFGIVTPGASLLVLERLEQYVAHHVEPPQSRPQMREQYLRLVAADEQQVAAKRGGKLERVVAMWEQRLAWWRREFPQRPAFDARKKERRRGGEDALDLAAEGGVPGGVEGGVAGGVVGGVVGGLPEAPPPAPAPVRAGGSLALASRQGAAGVAMPSVMPAEMEADESKKATADGRTDKGAGGPTIVLKPWDPDMPYLRSLRAAPAGEAYAVFLRERGEHGKSPAFFLDCADHFARAGQRMLALRVLTDVVELQLAEPRLLRIAAHRLQQMGELDLAVALFEEVLRLRPEEPQSLRDLALAVSQRAEEQRSRDGRSRRAAAADFARALELLNRIVITEWDGRFPQIEVIALEEANRIASIVARDPGLARVENPIDARLREPITFDLRVALTWDTDLTDMDLWVVEPSGERCYYSHALTSVGGAITRDFTQGYGPEVYAIRRALAGRYRIQTNFFGSGAQSLTGPTTVQATVITDFGRASEKRQALTVRLTERKDVVDVGEVTIAEPAPKPAPPKPAAPKPVMR